MFTPRAAKTILELYKLKIEKPTICTITKKKDIPFFLQSNTIICNTYNNLGKYNTGIKKKNYEHRQKRNGLACQNTSAEGKILPKYERMVRYLLRKTTVLSDFGNRYLFYYIYRNSNKLSSYFFFPIFTLAQLGGECFGSLAPLYK